MIKTIRRIIAGKFGQCEHWISRILGIALIITAIQLKDILHYSLATLWILYWLSHLFEKKIYGKYGYR